MAMKSLSFMISFMLISSVAHCFELYGSWKTEDLSGYNETPLKIIRFDKTTYYYGKYSLDAKYKNEGDKITVECTPAKLKIVIKDDNKISVTFPNPRFPQNITYTRISDEEAAKLLQQDR